jgi:hypothetical protein
MRILLVIGAFLSATAFAATNLQVTEINGVSASQIDGNGTDVKIVGGTAGIACTGADQYSTCDSCALTTSCTDTVGDKQDFCACNQKRIYDNLVATLTIAGGDGHTLRAAGLSAQTTSGISVSVRWSDLCAHMPGAQGSCEMMNQNGSVTVFDDTNEDGVLDNGESSLMVTVVLVSPMAAGASAIQAVSDFNVFGQPNAVGLGGFTALPAQNGVKLGNLLMGSTTLPYGANVNGIRIFTSDIDMAHASPMFAKATTDLPVSNKTTSLAIDHLVPMTQYFFRTALVDEGGNLVQFFPDQGTLAEQYPQCLISGQVPVTCPFAGIPTN